MIMDDNESRERIFIKVITFESRYTMRLKFLLVHDFFFIGDTM